MERIPAARPRGRRERGKAWGAIDVRGMRGKAISTCGMRHQRGLRKKHLECEERTSHITAPGRGSR